MREIVLCENAVVEAVDDECSCPISLCEISAGEHAVRLGDDETASTHISIASVDELVHLLRDAASDTREVDFHTHVTYESKDDDEELFSCVVCREGNTSARFTILPHYSGRPVRVCADCTSDLADALERVWEHGDALLDDHA